MADKFPPAKGPKVPPMQPYGYLREKDGQIQISIGPERPHNRSGGYATPWFAIYTTYPAAASVPDEQHSERFDWTLGQWAEHVVGHYQGNDPANYYEFGSFMAVAAMLSQFGTVQQKLGWNACRAAMLQGAEPVTTTYKLPDGWVAVPIEPTEDMIVYGFESEPDEDFSDPAVWEEYQAMSGCQQAAHRAKLCWASMIAAAPKLGDE